MSQSYEDILKNLIAALDVEYRSDSERHEAQLRAALLAMRSVLDEANAEFIVRAKAGAA